MTIILFNPKSRLGNNQKLLHKIETMIRNQGHAVVLKNVLTIGDTDGFLELIQVNGSVCDCRW